ncbi:NADH dehydrogenase [ubiquinone] flavoprotein 1, mitochondrial [Drosophila guanche]|uniref:Blast:NADH dehydrogenase n=1 Tax=Drosophila guanche TaxID=7266 RepID=A0A3B0JRC9_DROGU|nr:NADH dehydrogenase [ubiquinone] flavoprotein 1, mitochondrial [Drosophila guanche]SPP75906.1 blast:NADH dehydrogenase [Drosophila guanche]
MFQQLIQLQQRLLAAQWKRSWRAAKQPDKPKRANEAPEAQAKAKDRKKTGATSEGVVAQNNPPKSCLTNKKTTFGPLHDCERVFQNLYGRHDWRMTGACKRGDWYRTADLLDKGPDWIMDQVCQSGLRGRGGGGYFTGTKWNFLRTAEANADKVLVMNCAEGEPGTCKDRQILRHEPHKLIEGCLLAGFAMGCTRAIIYVRNRFYNEACNLQFALAEAYRHGLLGSSACNTGIRFDILVQRGDRYLCGEETALVKCLTGEIGRPHRRPPFLTDKGYFSHPCLVINAETVAVLPTILRRGPRWWADLGRSHNSGTKLFNISGHVNCPCTVEEEMSMPMRDLIEKHAGGVRGGWDNLLAVFPGGLSTSLINKQVAAEVLMDFECLEAAGSSLGSGALIVVNKQSDPIKVMLRSIQFYEKHTCKQCTYCRDGAIWLPELFDRFVRGEAHPHEIDWTLAIGKKIKDSNPICGLAQGQVNVACSLVDNFRPQIEDRILKCIKA